ncbi:MAG: hypothetical protein RJA49_1103 [Actinomycetota bacterium]
MTITDVRRDPANLSMTISTEFDQGVDEAWQLWANPRLLEQWWGPPTWPATFVEHDLSVGSRISYYMTGPEGEHAPGWWRITAADAPRSLEFENGFSSQDGSVDESMPVMHMRIALVARPDGGTRMDVQTNWASLEEMERIVAMGMEEGLSGAMSQMDALLA